MGPMLEDRYRGVLPPKISLWQEALGLERLAEGPC